MLDQELPTLDELNAKLPTLDDLNRGLKKNKPFSTRFKEYFIAIRKWLSERPTFPSKY